MRIFFLTREPDVCQLLADRFAGNGTEIKIFPVISQLLQTLFDFNIIPDILFLDYLYFQPDYQNFYDILKKKGIMFPVVYYNHPFPIPSKRKFFWSFNLLKSGNFSDISNIEPLLETMESALADPQISPYVSAIQQPLPYRSSDLRYIEPLKENEIQYYMERFDNTITDHLNKGKNKAAVLTDNQKKIESIETPFAKQFRVRHRLSHKIFVLFNHLYNKKDSHVTLEELKRVLSRGSKEETANGIRLAIYRLRSILREDIKCKLEILNYDYGYSMIETE